MTSGLPKLTPKQERIFRFMADYFPKHQAMPSIREICAEFGIRSPNGVVCHLVRLEAKGYIHIPRSEHDEAKRARNRGYEITGLSDALAPMVADHVKGLLGPRGDTKGKRVKPKTEAA